MYAIELLMPTSVERLATLADEFLGPAPAVASGSGHRGPRMEPRATGADAKGAIPRLKVDQWLQDYGVDFTKKPNPDSIGRTIWVLDVCPFNPEHGPDSCVMQDANGKMSAQCFHNGCAGKGWQEFKDQIGQPQKSHKEDLQRKSSRRRKTTTSRQRFGSGGRNNPSTSGEAPNSANPTDPAKSETISSAANDTPSAATAPNAVRATNGQRRILSEEEIEEILVATLPPPDPATVSANGPPRKERRREILGNRRQLPDVTRDAMAAIRASNDPPRLFQRCEQLVRVRLGAECGETIEILSDAALRGVMARSADWKKIKDGPDGECEEDDAPPMDVVKDLGALADWPGIPSLDAIVRSPVFSAAGELLLTPGYASGARLWYQPAQGFCIEPVSNAPSDAEINAAKERILVDLLGDFPFKDQASRAHAVAASLLPFVRPMIDGPTPLHLFDAPTEGTGKTLLASCIARMATGRDVEAITEGGDDAEWRKRITSCLLESPTCILLDNLNRRLDSGSLASVLTSRLWKDRVLGHSRNAVAPNTPLWMASGNNAVLSPELIRRTLWCRLDAKMDNPSARGGFRHPNLLAWVRDQRAALVHAALTLVQAWIASDRPKGSVMFGMFESWAETMGGILEVAGIPGLLTNARDFRENRSDKQDEWREFVAAWWETHADRPVGVKGLFQLARDRELLAEVLGDGSERSQSIRLGKALGKNAERVFGEHRFERDGKDKNRSVQYRMMVLPQPNAHAAEVCRWEL